VLARKYTAWALAKFKDARAVDALLGMFHDRVYEEDDDGTVEVDEPDFEAIEAAIWALTEIGDERALEPIISLQLAGQFIEGTALRSWGKSAFDLLAKGLQSEDGDRRGTAAALLGEFGDPDAVPLLIEVLQNDKSDRARHGAAYALGELRDLRAYDALRAALNDPYDQTRMYAGWALDYLKELCPPDDAQSDNIE
jgi:HEAT repeat protein